MKKLLVYIGILLLPMVASAAYNDVQMTNDSTVINASGVNLTVMGGVGLAELISNDGTNLTFSLEPNSTTTIQSTDRRALAASSLGSASATYSCLTGSSILNLTSSQTSGATGVVVTVGSVACDDASQVGQVSSSGGGSSGGGGGGGGSSSSGSSSGSSGAVAVATTPTNTTNTTTNLQSQINALNAQIAAHAGTSSVTATTFIKPLAPGVVNAAVKILQKILNSDPDTKIASAGAGSPGKETTLYGPATKKAIQKFQIKYKIAKPGDVGYGNFGPITKAKMLQIAKSLGM